MVTTVGLRGAMVRALLAALLVGGGVAWFSHGSTAHGLALNVPLFSSDSGGAFAEPGNGGDARGGTGGQGGDGTLPICNQNSTDVDGQPTLDCGAGGAGGNGGNGGVSEGADSDGAINIPLFSDDTLGAFG